MTQEEKAKSYDEALERAKKEIDACGSQNCDAVRQIFRLFPELKDEDGRIKNTLIDYFKNYKTQEEIGIKTFFGIPTDNIIAWLEKQDNKSINIDIESMVSSYKQRLLSQGQGNLENNSLINMCLSAFKHGVENVLEELNLKKLEKQDNISKEVTCTYEVKVGNGNIKGLVTEGMSIYNVEPKFNVGDWVVISTSNGRKKCTSCFD